MDCEEVNIGGHRGFICRSGGRRCEFCHERHGANQCDHLMGGPCRRCKGTGKNPRGGPCHPCAGKKFDMCNRFFCGVTCGQRISPDEGYCPLHEHTNQKLEPEETVWIDGNDHPGPCLRRSCRQLVPDGVLCLYFPARQRVMHEVCGQEYLRLVKAAGPV